jgi:ankyrin repeat protein
MQKAPMKNGQTSLSSAPAIGHLEAVKLLLEKEAAHSPLDNMGIAPLCPCRKQRLLHIGGQAAFQEIGSDTT